MPGGEFALIERYFAARARQNPGADILLGIGDDAAVIQLPQNQQLVMTLDTLVSGRHFLATTDPADIAYKSLAVNVSDLVAMGASPFCFLLSLTLPQADDVFLQAFAQGLFDAAEHFAIRLIGGDTCKGPLSISIQATGLVEGGRFITRGGARVGDRILVSGELGAAALGLAHLQHRVALSDAEQQGCLHALQRPRPRLDLLELIRSYASAAIDLSDGLVGDLRHVLEQSGVGAKLQRDRIPAYPALIDHGCFDYALSGGDDYQILLTVAAGQVESLQSDARLNGLQLTDIGEITAGDYVMSDGARCLDLSTYRGYDHFAA